MKKIKNTKYAHTGNSYRPTIDNELDKLEKDILEQQARLDKMIKEILDQIED